MQLKTRVVMMYLSSMEFRMPNARMHKALCQECRAIRICVRIMVLTLCQLWPSNYAFKCVIRMASLMPAYALRKYSYIYFHLITFVQSIQKPLSKWFYLILIIYVQVKFRFIKILEKLSVQNCSSLYKKKYSVLNANNNKDRPLTVRAAIQ
jgi:hypothetical protein